MGKIKFMAEEFFRSFRRNLFKNVILMVMFAASLVMTILMGSYYLDLGEESASLGTYTKNGTWYGIGFGLATDTVEMDDSTETLQGCRKIMDYYECLHDSAAHPILTVNTQQECSVREDDFQELLGNGSYDSFVSEESPTAETIWFGSEDEGESCSALTIKCASMDDTAFKVYGLRTGEGEGFSRSSLTIEHASDPIPILLGYEYKGKIPVGEAIEISYVGYSYPCRVAGILEKGSMIPSDGDGMAEMVVLDSYIIFPYNIRVSEKTDKRRDIEKYANLDLMALEWGFSKVRANGDSGARDLTAWFRDMGNEYGYPPPEPSAGTMGLQLLHNESAARVRVLLILTLTLIGFTFYGLFAAFYDKIQSNKRTYGIYRMNGCSMGMILVPYLCEIAVVLAPAFFACRYIFTEENFYYASIEVDTGMIVRVTGCFIGLAFLAGAVFIICLLKGVDTEQLVRQKE